MLRLFFLVFAALLFPASTHALDGNFAQSIREKTLENGLRVVVVPDRRAPVVTHMIWYKVGSADDPLGKSGIAHFLEHLMFKGTSNVPQGEFSEAVSAIGGQENAFTSYDYTAYYQKVSPDALPDMMRYEADRMRNIILTDEVVYPERQVILEERSSRVDENPNAILSEFVQASLFVHHPYGIPVIGWEHEIAKLERDDILEFYERWYQPWNAVVIVAGDVEADTVFDLAGETYGKVEASREPENRNRVADPASVVSKQIEYADPRVTTPVWRRSFVVPSYRTATDLESEALDLLAAILGQSVRSRIYENLVLGETIATSAGAFYQGTAVNEGYFGLYATPRGETSLEELSEAMEQQINLLLKDGVTQEELDRARKTQIQSVAFSQDSQVTLARIFGTVLSTGGGIVDVTGWSERLKEVTVQDVNAVARKYLDRSSSVTSQLLPESAGAQ